VAEPEFGAIIGVGPPDEDEDEDVVFRACSVDVVLVGGLDETVLTARTALVGADDRTVVERGRCAVSCTTLVFADVDLAAF